MLKASAASAGEGSNEAAESPAVLEQNSNSSSNGTSSRACPTATDGSTASGVSARLSHSNNGDGLAIREYSDNITECDNDSGIADSETADANAIPRTSDVAVSSFAAAASGAGVERDERCKQNSTPVKITIQYGKTV